LAQFLLSLSLSLSLSLIYAPESFSGKKIYPNTRSQFILLSPTVVFAPLTTQLKEDPVSDVYVENTPNKIIGVIPETAWANSKIEIRSQFSGSGSTSLKTPRVITSEFTIEHV
jgi:hypothetical protein